MMHFENRPRFSDTEKVFTRAKYLGFRYAAIISHPPRRRGYLLDHHEGLWSNDAMDIVRRVRELGLRPGAERATLTRIFNTADKAFIYQYNMSAQELIDTYLPADARQAYERYLAARAKVEETAAQKGKPSRPFGRWG